MCSDKRKIQHVDHLTMEKAGIAVGREQMGYMSCRAALEDQAIEQAVDEIAQRTREDQRRTGDKTPMTTSFCQFADIKNPKQHRRESKQGEDQLSRVPAKRYARRHAFVLDKIDLRLVAQQVYAVVIRRHRGEIEIGLMTQRHMRLDPNFQGLIRCNDEQHKKKNMPGLQFRDCVRQI